MGSSGSLLAGAAALFLLGSAIVAFRGWPQLNTGPATTNVVASPVPVASRTTRRLTVALAAPRRAAHAPAAGSRGGVRLSAQAPPVATGSAPGAGSVGAPTGVGPGGGTTAAAGGQTSVVQPPCACNQPPQNPITRLTAQIAQGVSNLGAAVGGQVSGASNAAANQVSPVSPPGGSAVQTLGSTAGSSVTGAGNSAASVISGAGGG